MHNLNKFFNLKHIGGALLSLAFASSLSGITTCSDPTNCTLNFGDNNTTTGGTIIDSTTPIRDANITFGSNNTITSNLTIAKGTSNINNTKITFENNNTIAGFLYGASGSYVDNTTIIFGDNASISNLIGAYTSNNNILNTNISLGKNATIEGSLYGARIDNIYGTANGYIYNTTIKLGGDARIGSDLIGAEIDNGNINNTTITIGDNATIQDYLRGAYINRNGNIDNTTITIGDNANIVVNISNLVNTSNLVGAHTKAQKWSESNDISNTTITIGNNATIGGNLFGAISEGGHTIKNSTIRFNGSAKVTGDIIGGMVTSGTVSGSQIYIHGDVNAKRIIGGIIVENTLAKAINNLIYIDTDVNMPNTTLHGGELDYDYSYATGGNVLTGNRLYFGGRKGTFKDIANFEYIDINITGPITNITDPIITLTGTGVTNLDRTNVSVLVDADIDMSNIDIIRKTGAGGTITAPKSGFAKVLRGVSTIENFTLEVKDSNRLVAIKDTTPTTPTTPTDPGTTPGGTGTGTGSSGSGSSGSGSSGSGTGGAGTGTGGTGTGSATPSGSGTSVASPGITSGNPGGVVLQERTQNVNTAAISESESLLAGNDVIDLVFLSKSIKSNTLETFGMIRGGVIENTAGANTNTKIVNLIAGAGTSIGDDAEVGLFFEGGYGNYNSSTDTVHGTSNGEGSSSYYGAGALLAYNLTQSMYLESSLRLGQIKTSYASDNLGLETTPISARFNTTKLYYGGHIGLGNITPITQNSNIDLYVKTYYGQIGQDDVVLDTKDKLSFSATQSLIGKLGARYNYNIASNFALYGGGSYEYEALGDIKTTTSANVSYLAPNDKRSTFAIEGGTQILPTSSDNVILNVHAKYLMGARQGIAGSLKGTYRF